MKRLYSPRNEGELAFLRSLLNAEGIPYFVHNDFFGSLRIGPEIDLLNMKTIMVSDEHAANARDLILDYLAASSDFRPTAFRDKVRVVLEFMLFHWFIPGRMPSRRNGNQVSDDSCEAV